MGALQSSVTVCLGDIGLLISILQYAKNLLEAKNHVLKPNSHQDPYDSPITGQVLLLSSPISSYTISISTGPWH